jgi:hypothetical protein
LFEAFEQGTGRINRQYGGTGLGLAIASQLAEMMRGFIEVKSAGEGQGSEFIVHLFLKKVSAAAISPQEPLPSVNGRKASCSRLRMVSCDSAKPVLLAEVRSSTLIVFRATD